MIEIKEKNARKSIKNTIDQTDERICETEDTFKLHRGKRISIFKK